MCINSVATSVNSSVHFSWIFPYVTATSYHSNLCLFWVENEIKCKHEIIAGWNQGEVFLRITLLWVKLSAGAL